MRGYDPDAFLRGDSPDPEPIKAGRPALRALGVLVVVLPAWLLVLVLDHDVVDLDPWQFGLAVVAVSAVLSWAITLLADRWAT